MSFQDIFIFLFIIGPSSSIKVTKISSPLNLKCNFIILFYHFRISRGDLKVIINYVDQKLFQINWILNHMLSFVL